jgi:hypothetical protein
VVKVHLMWCKERTLYDIYHYSIARISSVCAPTEEWNNINNDFVFVFQCQLKEVCRLLVILRSIRPGSDQIERSTILRQKPSAFYFQKSGSLALPRRRFLPLRLLYHDCGWRQVRDPDPLAHLRQRLAYRDDGAWFC